MLPFHQGDSQMSLGQCEVMAFVATVQPEKARAFYCDVLGLPLEEDSPFAIVVRAANASVRIQKVRRHTPFPYTALGWKVDDIAASVRQLLAKGVQLQRIEGVPQDELGVWTSPSGAKVCWFKDPDGNVLSLTQFG
jgi:catechol 2,3-dioxygenase-like lactoylglutathione lyase family enzyme